MTFVFLGMFVASSAGEILFNKEEADILMHRPITARDLLWSKIRVLVEISLWLAGALNLVGLYVGIHTQDGGILFPFVHIASTILEALFATSCIVLAYQLCLRWFGRERLDALMTTTQVFAAVALVFAGQMLPRLILRINGLIHFGPDTWWIGLLPPAWFACMDDALAGHGTTASWILAGVAVAATSCTLWLAFGKLAHDYQTGLQSLGETVSRPRARSKRRWMDILVNTPPLKWFFRTPVSRAGFLLTTAYLIRDRDVKLRVYPGLAPMLVMPFIFLLQGRQMASGFGLAFSGGFLACMPLIAIDLLQYSQQWQASDIFRVMPMPGPAELCHGARRAVLFLLAVPLLVLVILVMWVAERDATQLLLFLPGIIAMPVVALVPSLLRRGVPLSLPNEEAKSAGRSLKMFAIMILALVLSGIALWTWSKGWFSWMLIAELLVAIPLYLGIRTYISKLPWRSIE